MSFCNSFSSTRNLPSSQLTYVIVVSWKSIPGIISADHISETVRSYWSFSHRIVTVAQAKQKFVRNQIFMNEPANFVHRTPNHWENNWIWSTAVILTCPLALYGGETHVPTHIHGWLHTRLTVFGLSVVCCIFLFFLPICVDRVWIPRVAKFDHNSSIYYTIING